MATQPNQPNQAAARRIPRCCAIWADQSTEMQPSATQPPEAKQQTTPSHPPAESISMRKRVSKTLRRSAPAALLLLIPKCPMCLAAYIAFATGISIPLTAATYLRTSLLAACITAILYVAIQQTRKALRMLHMQSTRL